MGKTKLIHSVPLVVFFMALALIGWPVIEFVITVMITIAVGAILLYTVLGFFYAIDRIIDFFYTAK